MPIFEYQCSDCEREFEAFVTAERSAECPACHGANLRKRLSSPGLVSASDGSNGSRSAPALPVGRCGAGGAHCACRHES